MVRAEGYGAWWNQYGDLDLAEGVARAQRAQGLRFVIVKYGMPQAERALASAGVYWATEAYVYPDAPQLWGQRLGQAAEAGAAFAVINAEKEWEREGEASMEALIRAFRRTAGPEPELYASVDTRGSRMGLPYQRVLARHVAGWMPMIYPLAFYPSRPPHWVAQAFRDALDGKDFGGKLVMPTIQTYDGIGSAAVEIELAEVRRRRLAGCQAYTIRHATDSEWDTFVRGIPEDGDDEMAFTEQDRETLNATKEHAAQTRYWQGIEQMVRKDAGALEAAASVMLAGRKLDPITVREARAVLDRYAD